MKTLTPIIFYLVLVCPLYLLAQANCDGTLSNNIFISGDMGNGSTPFQINDPFLSNDFTYSADWPINPNSYTLVSSTIDSPSSLCWINTSDNSPTSNGYMLIANAGNTAEFVFEQTIEVCDGVDYIFSADFINLSECTGTVAPVLEFWVDGQAVFNTGVIPQDNNWHTYSTSIFIPTGVDFIALALRSVAVGSVGNDFAIDNIELRHCGPSLTIPSITNACADNPIIISPDITNGTYSTPYYQWQQSFDGGTSWQDINGAIQAQLLINDAIEGVHYRLQMANGPINFLNTSCHITSNPTLIESVEPLAIYLTPTICEGDTISIGGALLSEAGTYSIPIAGETGCDSIIYAQVFTYPSYEQWFTASLCEGASFRGEVYFSDTILIEYYSSQYGCDSTVLIEIDVATAENLQIEGNELLCGTEELLLTASPGFVNYQWGNGSINNSITITEGGYYEVTATNSAGCSLITGMEIMESAPSFFALANDLSCEDKNDGQLEITSNTGGAAPYLYSINEEAWQTNPTFNNLAADTYTLGIQDALGCEYFETIEVGTASPLSFEIGGLPNEAIDLGDTLILAVSPILEGYTLTWKSNGILSCDTCATTSWQPFYSGELSLQIISPEGCLYQLSASLPLLDRYRVYIPNAFSPNDDDYNDTFAPFVGSNVEKILSWEIYDRWGGRVFAVDHTADSTEDLSWDGSWRGQPLASGVYLYRTAIQFNNGHTKLFAGEVTLLR